VFELDITSISAMVAAAGVLVGVVYYILDMRNQTKQRQTDMVMRIYAAWESMELRRAHLKLIELEFEDYADYARKCGFEEKAAFSSVVIFFEGLGVLVKRKLISMDLVDDLISSEIVRTWEKIKPLVEGARKKTGRPQYFEWFEYLYNEMQKREQAGVKSG